MSLMSQCVVAPLATALERPPEKHYTIIKTGKNNTNINTSEEREETEEETDNNMCS